MAFLIAYSSIVVCIYSYDLITFEDFSWGQVANKKRKTDYIGGELFIVQNVEEFCYFTVTDIIKSELGFVNVDIYFKKRGLCLHKGRKLFKDDNVIRDILSTKDITNFVSLYVINNSGEGPSKSALLTVDPEPFSNPKRPPKLPIRKKQPTVLSAQILSNYLETQLEGEGGEGEQDGSECDEERGDSEDVEGEGDWGEIDDDESDSDVFLSEGDFEDEEDDDIFAENVIYEDEELMS